MADSRLTPPAGWLTSWRKLPNDSPGKIVLVAVALCVVCSVMVSVAAVLLAPRQEANRTRAVKTEILRVAGLLDETKDLDTLFASIDTRLVDLASGQYVADLDPGGYDYRRALRDPAWQVPIAPADDLARIRTRARLAPVYLVRDRQALRSVIVPVHGYGLWSTMHAFVALSPDGRSILGVSFYEHAETAGLGGEISNPDWQAQWHNKRIADDRGRFRFRVAKGTVDPGSPDAVHEVDGLAGATLTSNGVTRMMAYWLGEQGFGHYLTTLQRTGEE